MIHESWQHRAWRWIAQQNHRSCLGFAKKTIWVYYIIFYGSLSLYEGKREHIAQVTSKWLQ